MQTIKVIKLYNGDEIVAYTEQFNDHILVKDPFQFFLKFDKNGAQSIAIDFWLPVPVIKQSEAKILNEKIIAVMDPSDDFSEYYENVVKATQKKSSSTVEGMSLIDEENEETRLKILLEHMDIPSNGFIN